MLNPATPLQPMLKSRRLANFTFSVIIQCSNAKNVLKFTCLPGVVKCTLWEKCNWILFYTLKPICNLQHHNSSTPFLTVPVVIIYFQLNKFIYEVAATMRYSAENKNDSTDCYSEAKIWLFRFFLQRCKDVLFYFFQVLLCFLFC